MNEATLQAIRDTLREKFPGMQILDSYQGGKKAQAFRIERGGRLVHHLFVARELLDARRQTALSTIFDRFEIVRVVEEAGAREVSVTSRGVTVQKPPPEAAAPAPAPAPKRERENFRFVPSTPAPSAAPPAEAGPPPEAETEVAAAVVPPAPVPTPAPLDVETQIAAPVLRPTPEPTAPPPAAETPVAAPVVPPAPAPTVARPAAETEVAKAPAVAVAPPVAPGDSFAAALALIRELRESLQGIDDSLGQSVPAIDADLAQAEASVVDAEARFQRATAQLTHLVTSMDTAVAKARAGLDRVKRRSR